MQTYQYKIPKVRVVMEPSGVKASERPKLTSSHQVYECLVSSWDKGNLEYIEEFKAILLNRANRLLGIQDVSKGGIAGTVADPKVILSAALSSGASSVILTHNHPSGNLNPSREDILLTKKIVEGAKLLDISVLDHVIVTAEGYYSFADEGMI